MPRFPSLAHWLWLVGTFVVWPILFALISALIVISRAGTTFTAIYALAAVAGTAVTILLVWLARSLGAPANTWVAIALTSVPIGFFLAYEGVVATRYSSEQVGGMDAALRLALALAIGFGPPVAAYAVSRVVTPRRSEAPGRTRKPGT